MSPEDEWTISTIRGERLTEDTSLVALLPLLLQHPVHALHLMRHELHIETVDSIATLFKTALDDFHEDTDVDTALKGLDLTRLEDKIDGLNVQLMPHQVQGVHWMFIQSGLEQSRDAVISQKSRFKAHPSEVVGLSTS
jgi:hypothetical protein